MDADADADEDVDEDEEEDEDADEDVDVDENVDVDEGVLKLLELQISCGTMPLGSGCLVSPLSCYCCCWSLVSFSQTQEGDMMTELQ